MPPRLRTALRRVVASILYYSGLLWLYAAIRLHRRVVVLMYHRVLPSAADSFSDESIVVTPETFSRHVRFLKRHFNVLSSAELADALDGNRRFPSRGCVITFDDGWHDNHQFALSILRREHVPAVVFLATDYIGTESCFWQERLARLLWIAIDGGAGRSLIEEHAGPGIVDLPPGERRRAMRAVVTGMKAWPRAKVASFESDLLRALGAVGRKHVTNGDDRFMSWRQVAELQTPGPFSIGAHGCSHAPLTSLTQDELRKELSTARARIESVVDHQTTVVAYPNGDYDTEVIAAARDAGYRLGFTTKRGLVAERDDPLRLRRLNVHEASTGTMPELLCLILGVFQRWPRQL